MPVGRSRKPEATDMNPLLKRHQDQITRVLSWSVVT
jgi:hypothetical protein